ncbi:HalOD1 output domain-containing protein [Halomicroarcula sp. GCM10025709]|uniref:HalOD1 output domain-containing protein n=1 Tax=Haloarcula TaxID=2237 RepID=UPI0024C2B754|nr:HalOD1 output domain-containing protein [Halomicroarcula sp. YJ-61-S]
MGTVHGGVTYHPDSDTYRASFSDGEPATTAVVRTLARVRHCDVTDISPLYESVDTDALDRLISTADEAAVRVEFLIDGFEVTVVGDNTVEIVPPT